MNPQELRIIFLGTPEFAVASLNALVQAGYNIETTGKCSKEIRS
jgi:methionyl-tRNA formyltransferase